MSTSEEEWDYVLVPKELAAMAKPVTDGCINRHFDPSDLDAVESEWCCMLDLRQDGAYNATFLCEEDMEHVAWFLRKYRHLL